MNNHQILGVSEFASEEEIKKAYRKLAMIHHPDRGGNTEDFQRIQTAYSILEKNNFKPAKINSSTFTKSYSTKPEAPGNTWRAKPDDFNDIYDQMKRSARGHPGPPNFSSVHNENEVIARVKIKEAFLGFNLQISKHQNGVVVPLYANIPGGTPDGFRGKYQLSDGSFRYIHTRIDAGEFKLKGFNDQDDMFSSSMNIGDMEITVEVNAVDLIFGGWIKINDFLDDVLSVRIPEGFNPIQRLKVANKGYFGWDYQNDRIINERQNLYVKVIPLFSSPSSLDKQKIIELYKEITNNESK